MNLIAKKNENEHFFFNNFKIIIKRNKNKNKNGWI